jgi:hypothetical protein
MTPTIIELVIQKIMMQGCHRAQQFKRLMNETPNVNCVIHNYQLSN